MGVRFVDKCIDRDDDTGAYSVTYALECRHGHQYASVTWPICTEPGPEAKTAQMEEACKAMIVTAESRYPIFWYMATRLKDLGAHWVAPRHAPVSIVRGVKVYEEQIGWPDVRATVALKKNQYFAKNNGNKPKEEAIKTEKSASVARVNIMRPGIYNVYHDLQKIPITANGESAPTMAIALDVFIYMMQATLSKAMSHPLDEEDDRPERMRNASVQTADFFYKKFNSRFDVHRCTKDQLLEAFCVANVVGGDTMFSMDEMFKMRTFMAKVRRAAL